MDAEQKTVETSAGTFSYGKCIYAMGAHNFIPPFPGKDLSGVYSIRTDKDMNAIRRGSLSAHGKHGPACQPRPFPLSYS